MWNLNYKYLHILFTSQVAQFRVTWAVDIGDFLDFFFHYWDLVGKKSRAKPDKSSESHPSKVSNRELVLMFCPVK